MTPEERLRFVRVNFRKCGLDDAAKEIETAEKVIKLIRLVANGVVGNGDCPNCLLQGKCELSQPYCDSNIVKLAVSILNGEKINLIL